MSCAAQPERSLVQLRRRGSVGTSRIGVIVIAVEFGGGLELISLRLRVDLPDDESMRISYEGMYRPLTGTC